MRKKISQVEARRLLKRVQEMERLGRERLLRYSSDYPGGINFHTMSINSEGAACIHTAQKLEHAIVVRIGHDDKLYFYAVRPA